MEPLGAPHPLRPRRARAPRAARTAVAVFRALEAAPIGLVVFDRALRFVHVNPWMARVNQLAREAHLGRTMRELFPGFAREVARTEARIRSVLETGRPAVFSVTASDSADHRHDWMATYFPVRLASGEIHCACGIIADITADREREAALARARSDAERTSRRLGDLQDVTAALAAAEDPAAVAEVVVDRVRPLVGAAAATMRVVRGDALELLAASRDFQVPASLRSVPLRAGYPVAAAVSRGEPIWLVDRAALEARFPEALEASGTAQAIGVVPLSAHGRSIGSIAFVFDRPQAFDLEDRAFLLAAAEQSAQALDRALAHESERTSRHLAQRATHRLARLQALTAALSGASTVGEVATVLVNGSRTTLGAQTAVTYVLEPATSTLVLAAAPLFASFFIGVMVREADLPRYQRFLDEVMLTGSTFFLGFVLGALFSFYVVTDARVLLIMVLGLVSIILSGLGGIASGLIAYKLSGGKINPLIGIAGVSCVPTTAKVAQKCAFAVNKQAIILPVAMGPNVAGVITTAIIARIYVGLLR